MKTASDGYLLRIYVGESAKYQSRPVYEAIVLKARELEMAGATVLHGPMGFGSHSQLHTAKLLALSEDLPIVIEIVDTKAKIDELLPHLDGMITGGTVTLSPVQVLRYSPDGG
jgi:hypothetical protein